MLAFPSNHYAEARRQTGFLPRLREGGDPPPERLLQSIWFQQRLCRDQLRTLDGRALRVLHPGHWNHEAGPDFREAVLQFDGEPPLTADVEIDLLPSGWHGHGHDRNPHYRRVALHVVWAAERSSALPTLALQPVLDAPLDELALWLGSEAGKALPLEFLGQCCAPLQELPAERLQELLRQAALTRLQGKAARFQARARQAGWEQALWEGLFRALGYKQNLWPMQRLAEERSRWCPETSRPDARTLQARLLGIGGLLPAELTRTQAATDDYLLQLWELWWRERDAFAEAALPRSLWKFNGIRPANHPQRRLALAAHWLARGGVPDALQRWCATPCAEVELLPALLETLQVVEDEFWSTHWTLRSAGLAKSQPLLGAARVTDLAVNVVLPWLWVRAVEGQNDAIRVEMERRYFAWPAAEDNAVLKLARQRLLGGVSARRFRGAAAQQGLLQVVQDYCEHSNALCAECRFPELVRQWPGRVSNQ